MQPPPDFLLLLLLERFLLLVDSVALTKSSRAKLVNTVQFLFFISFFYEDIVIRHVRKSFKSCSCFFFSTRPRFCSSPRLHIYIYICVYKTGIGRIDRIDISRTSFKKNIHWKFFPDHPPPGRGNSPPSRRYSGEQVIRNRGGDRVSHFPIRHWKNVSIESEYITRPVLHRRSGGRIRFYMVICTYHLPSQYTLPSSLATGQISILLARFRSCTDAGKRG